MSVLKCGKTSICIQFSINVFISNNLAQWILKKYLLLRWVIDFKDAESMYGIRERKKIMEGVQRCFFKNILILLSTEINMDLICTIRIDIRIIHDIFKYQLNCLSSWVYHIATVSRSTQCPTTMTGLISSLVSFCYLSWLLNAHTTSRKSNGFI